MSKPEEMKAIYFCKGDIETKKAVGKIASSLFKILNDYFTIAEKTICANCDNRFKTPCIEAKGRAVIVASHFLINVFLPVVQYNFGPETKTINHEKSLRKIMNKRFKKDLDTYLKMPFISDEKTEILQVKIE